MLSKRRYLVIRRRARIWAAETFRGIVEYCGDDRDRRRWSKEE